MGLRQSGRGQTALPENDVIRELSARIMVDEGQPKTEASGIYNPSVEYFLIFSMEALLQREMNPEVLNVINHNYLGNLFDHDKEVMSNETKYDNGRIHPPVKGMNHKNLNHIS